MPTPITELTRIELYTKADTYQEMVEVIDKRIELMRTTNQPVVIAAELRALRSTCIDLELLYRREARKQETVQKPL